MRPGPRNWYLFVIGNVKNRFHESVNNLHRRALIEHLLVAWFPALMVLNIKVSLFVVTGL